MSFPDPHHPWDPPQSELGRVNWRDVDLPAGYIADPAERERVLDAKPRHFRLWYDGKLVSNYEAPAKFVPAALTADQIREVNALNAIEVELIDEAIGRVLSAIEARGWGDDVDIVFTTDHGELQGDFGLLFKGPYHVDGLMRLPLIWRPAKSAGVAPAVVNAPVSHLSLAATFLEAAGVKQPSWVEAPSLPRSDDEAAQRGFVDTITEWDSAIFGVDVHLRTVTTSRYVYTRYHKGYSHDGSEGELYDLVDDPLQRVNRFGDPALKAVAEELQARLEPGVLVAPV
jgi:arylsulfatase A-like enzyme